MASGHAQRLPSLIIPGIVYCVSALAIGLPVYIVVSVIFVGLLNLFQLNWLVTSANGIIVYAAAFLIAVWVAAEVAEPVVNVLS